MNENSYTLLGLELGLELGKREWSALGPLDGSELGIKLGLLLGLELGLKLGKLEGSALGPLDGEELGIKLGIKLGSLLGLELGFEHK
jgi:hypothetical protein